MREETLSKTRRMFTLGLMSAGVIGPSTAQAQFSIGLGDIQKIVDIAETLNGMNIDEDDEIAMGQGLYGTLVSSSGGIYRNNAVQQAVSRIAASIFEQSERTRFTWEVAVLDNNEVNAWCLPGGKVGVNKGLLRYAASEDELAAVLSHEAGHAELSHVAREMKKKAFYKGLSDTATTAAVKAIDDNKVDIALTALQGPMYELVTSGYSRESEDEADLHIVKVFGDTNRNVHAGVGFFNTLLELAPRKSKRTTSLFSGHPQTKKRIDNILEAAPEGSAAPSPTSPAFAEIKTVFPTRNYYMRQPS